MILAELLIFILVVILVGKIILPYSKRFYYFFVKTFIREEINNDD
jgi:hypothetical protein